MSIQQNKSSNHPAQLLVGPHEVVVKYAKEFLKKQFCQQDGCLTCVACKQIDAQQHHGAIWLEPERQYTLDILEPISKQITFALEPDQKLFFIIQHADFLTPVCANSLLKSVEEPPDGYHFIFLTHRAQQILPTIRSRCVMHSFFQKGTDQNKQFTNLFKNKLTCLPSEFLKLLAQENPSERETVEHLDSLLAHWIAKSSKSLLEQKKDKLASSMVKLIKHGLQKPPMPGSSKLFWKNFYLQMQQL